MYGKQPKHRMMEEVAKPTKRAKIGKAKVKKGKSRAQKY